MIEKNAPIQNSNNAANSTNLEPSAVNVLVVKKKALNLLSESIDTNITSNNKKVANGVENSPCNTSKSQTTSLNKSQPMTIIHERVLRGSLPSKEKTEQSKFQADNDNDSAEEDNQDEKFDFDEDGISITEKSSLEFFHGQVPLSYEKMSLPSSYMDKLKTLKTLNMEMTNTALETVAGTSGIDPLNDKSYESFHRHMCKEEKRMIHMDKVEAANLAEQYEAFLDTLNLVTWKYYLPKITKINNPQNDEEMERKKNLTVETINKSLADYNDLNTLIKIRTFKLKNQNSAAQPRGPLSKKVINPYHDLKSLPFIKHQLSSAQMRSNKNASTVYQKIDRMSILDYDSSSDEEESSLCSSSEIKLYRNKKVFQKFKYPTIIIRCETFDIVAQPFQNPKIVKR